jgi:lipopolysaccharide assembly protein A
MTTLTLKCGAASVLTEEAVMATKQPVQPSPDDRSTTTSPAAESRAPRRLVKTPRSRAGAFWVGICIAALVLIALIVFMLQNTQPVLVTFLSMQGTVSLAIALLIAGIGVGIVALVIGTIRIGQLRRRLTHERRT